MRRARSSSPLLAGARALPRRRAAEPIAMRMATVAPEGSAWANLLRDWAREIEAVTNGAVRVKLVLLRHRRRRARGRSTASTGAARRHRLGRHPLRAAGAVDEVQALAGVFQSREEAAYVMERLRPTLEEETARAGFALLITTGLGPGGALHAHAGALDGRAAQDEAVALGRRRAGHRHGARDGPARRADRLDVAGKAYDDKRVDGFIAIPTAALAFQWSTQARYLTDLRPGYLTGCVLVAHRAFDRLTAEQQQTFRSLFAKYDALFQEMGRRQDEALLGGLFAKQGLKPIPPSEGFRSEFFEAARAARERAATQFVSARGARPRAQALGRLSRRARRGREPLRAT